MKEKYVVFYSGEDYHIWLPMHDEETGEPAICSSIESAHEIFNDFMGEMLEGGEIDEDTQYEMHIFKLQSSKKFTVNVPKPKVLFSL